MRNTILFVLLLSFKKPIVASARLVERQEQQGVWPDLGDLVWPLLRGLGDMFQGSDDWNAEPPPNTDPTQDKTSPPVSPGVVPAEQPSPDTSSPTEPVYKIKINNMPSPVPLPSLEPNPPALLPPVSEECNPMNVSLQIRNFFKLPLSMHDHCVNMGTHR